jgi:putative ABC transport system permease protein
MTTLRLAMRMLRANASLVTAAVMTLALGIGATTVMFSVTYGVLMRPLPYDESDRLVQLSERYSQQGLDRSPRITNITYFAWDGHSHTISSIATYGSRMFTVGLDAPVRLKGTSFTPSMLGVLRVTPALGRSFTNDDLRTGNEQLVILSDGLWRERFAGDPSAIGKTLHLDRRPYTIVGVAPRGFAFPDRETRLWMPQAEEPPVASEPDMHIRASEAIARLLPGVTADQAAAEGTSIARAQLWPTGPDPFRGSGPPLAIQVRPIVAEMTSAVRPILLLILGGAASLLLIACANVANLLLSRGAARERELAVMLALGASRRRVAGQLLIESVLIALLGGSAGIVVAALIIRVLPSIAPPDFPRLLDVHLDWTVTAFAVAASLVSGIASGLMPAVRSGRGEVVTSLRASVATSAARHTARHRRALLIAEASLAMAPIARRQPGVREDVPAQ